MSFTLNKKWSLKQCIEGRRCQAFWKTFYRGMVQFLCTGGTKLLIMKSGGTIVMERTLSMMALDHVIRNVTKQDMYSVSSIVDAAMYKLREEWPTVKHVWVVFDKEGTCQNNLEPAILPQIADGYLLQLKRLLKIERGRGNCLVGVHFSAKLRKMNNFVDEHEVSETTPANIVVPLRADGGIASDSVYLLYIRRVGPT